MFMMSHLSLQLLIIYASYFISMELKIFYNKRCPLLTLLQLIFLLEIFPRFSMIYINFIFLLKGTHYVLQINLKFS